MDRWRRNLKAIREKRGMSNSQLHQKSGVSKALISQLENGNRPFTQKALEDLAVALECSIYDFFCADGEEQPHRPSASNKVVGDIAPADLKLLGEWVITQDEPARMAANIRFMVETRYADFEEWIKKREQAGKSGTPAGSKSEINGE